MSALDNAVTMRLKAHDEAIQDLARTIADCDERERKASEALRAEIAKALSALTTLETRMFTAESKLSTPAAAGSEHVSPREAAAGPLSAEGVEDARRRWPVPSAPAAAAKWEPEQEGPACLVCHKAKCDHALMVERSERRVTDVLGTLATRDWHIARQRKELAALNFAMMKLRKRLERKPADHGTNESEVTGAGDAPSGNAGGSNQDVRTSPAPERPGMLNRWAVPDFKALLVGTRDQWARAAQTAAAYALDQERQRGELEREVERLRQESGDEREQTEDRIVWMQEQEIALRSKLTAAETALAEERDEHRVSGAEFAKYRDETDAQIATLQAEIKAAKAETTAVMEGMLRHFAVASCDEHRAQIERESLSEFFASQHGKCLRCLERERDARWSRQAALDAMSMYVAHYVNPARHAWRSADDCLDAALKAESDAAAQKEPT